MKKLFRFFLVSGHGSKRRRMVAGAALWLLRLLRDVENDEMCRNSDMLDRFDSGMESVSHRKYTEVEEACLACENALGFIDCAIVDLEYAY